VNGIEVDESALEDRLRHRLQRRIHPAIQLDFVVKGTKYICNFGLEFNWWRWHSHLPQRT